MKYKLTITTLLSLVVGCSSHPKSSTSVSDSLTGSTQIESAPFNVDSAYSYLKQQVDFGKRVPNSDAHAQCKSWLVEKLKSWGYNVQIQSFPGKD